MMERSPLWQHSLDPAQVRAVAERVVRLCEILRQAFAPRGAAPSLETLERHYDDALRLYGQIELIRNPERIHFGHRLDLRPTATDAAANESLMTIWGGLDTVVPCLDWELVSRGEFIAWDFSERPAPSIDIAILDSLENAAASILGKRRAPVSLPNDSRNAWLYDQFCKIERGALVPQQTIVNRLRTKCEKLNWSYTGDITALKRGVNGWAKRKGKPPIPARQQGRKRGKNN